VDGAREGEVEGGGRGEKNKDTLNPSTPKISAAADIKGHPKKLPWWFDFAISCLTIY
jgi:hypothetical protein